jgi:UrcA family protein
MKQTEIFLGSTLLWIAATGATAADAAGRDHSTFVWSPEALISLEGIQTTHERIEALATQFCRKRLRGVRGVSARAGCEKAVIEEIVSSIDDRHLTRYANTGKVDVELTASR